MAGNRDFLAFIREYVVDLPHDSLRPCGGGYKRFTTGTWAGLEQIIRRFQMPGH
jgi:hypothetical protein